MTVRIKIVQTDHTKHNLDIPEFSKIIAFKVTTKPSDIMAENQLDGQGFISSTDRG